MRSFKAVVFDMDGVIFDSERLVIDCWSIVARCHGIPDIETTCRACMGLNRAATRQIMTDRYGDDLPYDTYRGEVSRIYQERSAGGRLPMKPGVRELLSALREAQVRIALASSTQSSAVRRELSETGIISCFDKLVCGDMVENSKPAPDIFLEACRQLQVLPEDAYAIEDSYNGIRSASAAGLHPIMVPDLAEPTPEMEQLTEVILPSLLAVREYLL